MNTKLKLAGHPHADEDEPTLKHKVNLIVDERRRRTLGTVEKALLYFAEIGVTQVSIDELPNIHRSDLSFVLDWLKGEGLEVKQPRFSKRAWVLLG